MKVICLISLGLLMPLVALAQDEVSNILIRTGGNVSFKVNSLNRYQNGIAYADWTELNISYDDPDDSSNGWNLAFKANTIDFTGDGGNSMPLDVLQIQVADGGGTNDLSGPIVSGTFDLMDTEQVIVSGAPEGGLNDNKLVITFKCGKGATGLINQMPDFYVVDLVFRVYPN